MDLVTIIYISILLLSLLVGLVSIRFLDTASKIVVLYLIASVITETIGYHSLYFLNKKVNHILFIIYRPLAFIIWSLFFLNTIRDKKVKFFIRSAIFLLPLLCLIFFIFDKTPIHNTQIGLLLKGALVIYSIVYFNEILHFEENISSNPYFWFVTGVLFFNAVFFFLSAFNTYISSKNLELARKLFVINPLLNIIYYSLITYGFVCQRRLARS